MISRLEIEKLTAHAAGSPVLSVYLTIDPAWDAGREAAVTGLKARLNEFRGRLNPKEQAGILEDAEPIFGYLRDFEPDAGNRSLAFFSDVSENFFKIYPLSVPLNPHIAWEAVPQVKPLLEALDEYESYVVVLADRVHGKIFHISGGKIEEKRVSPAKAKVRHISEIGSDHALSQMNIQRKSEEHAQRHFKDLAEVLAELEKKRRFHRIFLAGPIEVIPLIFEELPIHLAKRVAAAREVSVHLSDDELVKKSLEWSREREREEEKKAIELLITMAKKGGRALTGVWAAVEAVQQGSIQKLFYSQDLRMSGARCTECGALFREMPRVCFYCGGGIEEIPDLVERMIQKVVADGGEIEEVRGAAAERLKVEGGIAAFLRFHLQTK